MLGFYSKHEVQVDTESQKQMLHILWTTVSYKKLVKFKKQTHKQEKNYTQIVFMFTNAAEGSRGNH